MLSRPRRNRKSKAVRAMVSENRINLEKLIYPYFLENGKDLQVPIASMPGIYRYSIDKMLVDMKECIGLGINNFILFPSFPEAQKDKEATLSWDPDNFYLKAISEAKAHFPDITITTDVAMDPYSSDGHDGLVDNGIILNDETLDILARMSIAQAEAGADILGPSDMMDGRVGFIREALDDEGFSDVSIMSYTAKYASGFYGPFREALDSAPKAGDKKTYQMDPANRYEAIREADLDEDEGADFLMVKPALSYLDVIATLKQHSELPIVAYNVSGEYSMVKAAAQNGWLDNDTIRDEILLSITRAGAEIIITYFAKEYAQSLQ